MSSEDKNLSQVDLKALGDCSGYKIGIVQSEWNSAITNKLIKGALKALKSAKVKSNNIFQLQVPGSFELPFGAKLLLQEKQPDAIICIGCVIKGETQHDEYINHAVASSISHLGLASNTPVIFGVLTPNSEQQAKDRAGGKHGNKGIEAAYTALKMIRIKKSIKLSNTKIGF